MILSANLAMKEKGEKVGKIVIECFRFGPGSSFSIQTADVTFKSSIMSEFCTCDRVRHSKHLNLAVFERVEKSRSCLKIYASVVFQNARGNSIFPCQDSRNALWVGYMREPRLCIGKRRGLFVRKKITLRSKKKKKRNTN